MIFLLWDNPSSFLPYCDLAEPEKTSQAGYEDICLPKFLDAGQYPWMIPLSRVTSCVTFTRETVSCHRERYSPYFYVTCCVVAVEHSILETVVMVIVIRPQLQKM